MPGLHDGEGIAHRPILATMVRRIRTNAAVSNRAGSLYSWPITPPPNSASSAPGAGRVPANILDLFIEFRDRTNGLATPCRLRLSRRFDLLWNRHPWLPKRRTRICMLILRGGPWSASERPAILDYCATDVDALERLLPAMLPLPHRSPARPVAWPLYGRRRRDGVERHADRRSDA